MFAATQYLCCDGLECRTFLLSLIDSYELLLGPQPGIHLASNGCDMPDVGNLVFHSRGDLLCWFVPWRNLYGKPSKHWVTYHLVYRLFPRRVEAPYQEGSSTIGQKAYNLSRRKRHHRRQRGVCAIFPMEGQRSEEYLSLHSADGNGDLCDVVVC